MYDFVLANFKHLSEKDIVLFGRSMGSGPCFHLAAHRKPGVIITMSAYTSIKSVVQDRLYLLGNLVNDTHFDNLKMAPKISRDTAVMVIHGKKDRLIDKQHAHQLVDAIKNNVTSELVLPERMTHNEFDFYLDFIRPCFLFF